VRLEANEVLARVVGEAHTPRSSVPLACDGAGQFAQYVSKNLRPPVLRYSQRLEFLREAKRLSVGRFEAHLIIAAALHRAGMGQEAGEPEVARSWFDEWAVPLMTCALVQALIVLGAWWVLR
jgi:hypothetical protein